MNASATKADPSGVGGWLLVLCVFLTVVGPVIVGALLVDRHAALAPRLDAALPYAMFLSTLLLTVAATAWGIVAGWRLWRVQPGAVAVARRALLAGLAADITCAAFDAAVQAAPGADTPYLRELLWRTLPDLVAFTACLGYLQHSARVQALFPEDAPGPGTTRR